MTENDWFKELLKRAGMNKAELARVLGIKASTISSWGIAPPTYATAYLHLLIKYNKLRP